MYSFDEYDEWYRSPKGPIATGDTLKLRLLLQRGKASNVNLVYNRDGGAPQYSLMEWAGVHGRHDVFTGEIKPESADLYWFYFCFDTYNEHLYVDGSGLSKETYAPFQLTVYEKGTTSPDWIKGGMIYQIFVDRYNRVSNQPYVRPGAVYRENWGEQPYFRPDERGIVHNNDFFGGSLEGIIYKLPLLQDMGVTCIYLNPIFDAASNHKYDTGNYLKVDPAFGDNEVLRKLCKLARDRGIRIVLDGVFNHVGEDSMYFNRFGNYPSVGAYQSQQSPYYTWFNFIHWNEDYESWWGIKLLPALNEMDESYQRFITADDGVIQHWIELGISGWRLDVVDELPDYFLDLLCAAAKRKDDQAIIIGEVWEDASNKVAYSQRRRYLLGKQLDSVMNYPLKDAIIGYLKEGDASKVASTMDWIIQNYPKHVVDCLMNILGTHDTMRILTVLGADNIPPDKEGMSHFKLNDEQRARARQLLKVASGLQFTLPGVPSVYYGDEAGMEGCIDPFNRACYPWGNEDSELLEWYHKLGNIRKDHPVFREGIYTLLCARNGVYAFSRGEGEQRLIIGANMSHQDYILLEDGEYINLLDGQKYSGCTIPKRCIVIYSELVQ